MYHGTQTWYNNRLQNTVSRIDFALSCLLWKVCCQSSNCEVFCSQTDTANDSPTDESFAYGCNIVFEPHVLAACSILSVCVGWAEKTSDSDATAPRTSKSYDNGMSPQTLVPPSKR